MALTVTPSAKAFIGLTETLKFIDPNSTSGQFTDGSQDDRIQRIIDGVCEALEGPEAVNGPILKAAATEYYDGGRAKILLRRSPVDASATFTVVEDGTTLDKAVDGTDEDASGNDPDYWLYPEEGIIVRNGTWKDGRRIVKVTNTAGLGTRSGTGAAITSDVPEDLRLAAMIWVKATYASDAASFSTQLSDGIAIRPVAMPPQVRALVQPYRNPR